MTIVVPTQRNRAAAPSPTDAEVLQRIALGDAARLRGQRDDAMARLRHAARRCETTTAADALREVARLDAEIIRALEVAADPAAELRRRERATVRVLLGGAL